MVTPPTLPPVPLGRQAPTGGLHKPSVCPHSSCKGDRSPRPSPCCGQAHRPPAALEAVLLQGRGARSTLRRHLLSMRRAGLPGRRFSQPGLPPTHLASALLGRVGGLHEPVLLPKAKPPGLLCNHLVFSLAFKAVSGLSSLASLHLSVLGMDSPSLNTGLTLLPALSLNCRFYR